jgi:cytosine/adenosine deaminase-related metal-dependent hydrolase
LRSFSVFTADFTLVGLEAIELLNEYGLLNISTPLIFSHASGITDNEIDLLRSSNQYISTTSESELHYGHGHPKSYEIMDQAALGIDTHFTFSSDIITQMRIHLQTTRLTLYNPVIGNDFLPSNTGMTVDQAFLMGTRNGGLALNRTDIGVIQVGAKADIVVFDTSSLGLLGWTDPVAAIVLHSNVGDIRDVIVDGKIKKRNKKLIGIDMPSLREEFLKRGQSVRAEFLRQNWTDFKVGLETELTGWTNDSFREVEIADVVRGNGTGFFGQGL